jgi:hypothetical protein
MKIRCFMFGHKLPEFLRLTTETELEGTTYSTRTDVYTVWQPCARCGRDFRVGHISVRDGKIVR